MRAEWSTEYLLDYGGKQDFYIQRLDTAFERWTEAAYNYRSADHHS